MSRPQFGTLRAAKVNPAIVQQRRKRGTAAAVTPLLFREDGAFAPSKHFRGAQVGFAFRTGENGTG